MCARRPTAIALFLVAIAAVPAVVRSQAGGGGCPTFRHHLLYVGPSRVAPGAGLLVGLGRWALPEIAVFPGDRAPRIVVKLRRGARMMTTTQIVLAPGLVRIVPARSLAPGPWQVEGRRSMAHAIEVSADPLPPELPAPALRAVETRVFPPSPPSSEHAPTRITVMLLDAPAAAGAVAYVVFARSASGESTPIQWSPMGTRPNELFVRDQPSQCELRAPGFRGPAPGEMLEVAWVDAAGRVSAHSAARRLAP